MKKILLSIILFLYLFSSIEAQNSIDRNSLHLKLDSLEKLADLDSLDRPIKEIPQAIKEAYQLNDSLLISHSLLIQASINMYLDNDKDFHKNLKTAESFLNKSKADKKLLVYYYNLLGINLSLNNDYKNGLKNYIEALKSAKEGKLEWQQIDINYNIMIVSYKLNDFDNCLESVNEILRLSKKFDTELRLNLTYYYGALLAIKKKEFNKAEDYLKKSKQIFEKDKSPSVSLVTEKTNFLIAYSKLHEAKGEYKQANSFLNKHRELLIEENKKAREFLAKNIKIENEIELKTNELLKSQAENKLKQKEINFNRKLHLLGTIALLVSLFSIYLLFKHSKSKSKNNALLLKSNKELDNARKEIEKNYNKNLSLYNNLSHEIKTPLHSINGLTEILKKQVTENAQDNINLLQHFNQTVFHFIEDAMYNTKDKSMISLSVYNEKIHVKKFIIDTVKQAKEINKYSFPININFDKDLPESIFVDRVKLGQIIDYLLSKSLQSKTNQNVIINLGLNSKNNSHCNIKISITDNTDTYNKDSIFRTYKLKDESSGKYDTGIEFGLIIAHKFLKIYNGELNFDFQNQNSIVTFNLNLADSSEINLSETTNNKLSFSPKILIVEDNKVNRLFTTKIITNAGYTIDEAEDGVVALEKVKNQHYDIIFMDIMMPGIDGFDTSRLIKKNNSSTVIVALSAITSLSKNNVLEESGISKFIKKPCLKTDLLSTIEEFSLEYKVIENSISV